MSAMANNLISLNAKSVCWTCRKRFSRFVGRAETCSDCGGALTYVGEFFRAPKRRDRRAWSQLEDAVRGGLTFDRITDSWGPGSIMEMPLCAYRAFNERGEIAQLRRALDAAKIGPSRAQKKLRGRP